jgi:hypothetical protein
MKKISLFSLLKPAKRLNQRLKILSGLIVLLFFSTTLFAYPGISESISEAGQQAEISGKVVDAEGCPYRVQPLRFWVPHEV